MKALPEGIYLRALAISKSWLGSLNVINEEILDIIKSSNINRMKELYDGRFNAKIIKSNINENINGISSNMLLFGSSIGIKKNQDIYNYFSNALGSGIYRRSFIYYEEPKEIKIRTNEEVVDESIIKFAISNIKSFLNNNIKDRLNGKEITININCTKEIEEINDKLLEFSNKNIEDERFSAEIGSLDKIVRLGALHAILNGRTTVESVDVQYAYDFSCRCRNTVQSLFNTEPQHIKIYKILKNYGELTKSEILEKDIFKRTTFNEDIELVKEYCYRINKKLSESAGSIKKFKITDLEINDLKNIIVSVDKNHKGQKAVQYDPLEVSFFGENRSIESLVLSENIDSFCLVHFDKKGRIENQRGSETAISGQNCIAFDFDDGYSIESVKELVSNFTYIIYTTKSHTEEKNRFRLIFPTKTKFYVNNEQHKELLKNIGDMLNLPTYDIATRNIDRLWFTNSKGTIYKNENQLLDVACCIPETERAIKSLSLINKENIENVSEDRRILGMIRYTVANTSKGNRNSSLYSLYKFVEELTDIENAKEVTYRTNGLLEEPVGEKEIQTIIRRL